MCRDSKYDFKRSKANIKLYGQIICSRPCGKKGQSQNELNLGQFNIERLFSLYDLRQCEWFSKAFSSTRKLTAK